MKILYINSDGGGFAQTLEVDEGTTAGNLFLEQVDHGRPHDYQIRVNRLPATAGQVLHDGDRVSFTPLKIHGAQ